MMKRMVLATLLTMLCCSNNLGAMDVLRNRIIDLGVGFGEAIEKVDNIPLIDKLTNLLPFAMVAACFKECPGQTMMVLTGLLFYVVSRNDSVRSTLSKCKAMGFAQFAKRQSNSNSFDDTLFIFDGEDEEDAQEEEDAEDALFSNIDDSVVKISKKDDLAIDKSAQQSAIKFI